MNPIIRRDFTGFDRQILSPAFVVDLGNRSWDTFVVETEKEAEDIVGPVTKHEIEKGVELHGGHVHLNCVFCQIGLVYEEHEA